MKHIRLDNRISRAIIPVILALALIAGLISASGSAFATEAEDELEDVEAQEEEAKTERAELEERIIAQQEEVDRLNDLVYAKQLELDDKQVQIDELIGDINNQRHSIDDRQGGLYDRLRSMYKKGSVSFLDVLLNSASFSELLTNLSMVQIIYQHDQDTLTDLEDHYSSLKGKMAEYGKAKAEMELAQAELEIERNSAEYAEAQLEESLAYVEARLAELEAEREELEAIIAEEQRKAAEAAAAAAAAGGYVYTGGGGTYIWPVSGHITSYYGYRDDADTYALSGSTFHTGIDIAVPTGTPVYAAASGTVSSATGWRTGYGYLVAINHDNGTTTFYGHNSSIAVSPGEYVEQGEIIAYSGSTGWSTGPHLHFELFVNGSRVDPMGYL